MMKIADMISKQDFYKTENATIYGAMEELYRLSVPIDILTIREYLNDRDLLERT